MAATKMDLTRTDGLDTRPDTEGLPTLFSRLGDDIMQLFNSQLAMFKVEIFEEASDYARSVTMIAIGAVIATIGFVLLNVAIAFAVSTLFAQANFCHPASYALGFVVTGGFYLLVGAIVVMHKKNQHTRQKQKPQRTVQE